jgi:hypothetical protein
MIPELVVVLVLVVVVEPMVLLAKMLELVHLDKAMMVALVYKIAEAVVVVVQEAQDNLEPQVVLEQEVQLHLLRAHQLLTLVVEVLVDLMVIQQVLVVLAVVEVVQPMALICQLLELLILVVAVVAVDGAADL